jgi:RES domain-containing protein
MNLGACLFLATTPENAVWFRAIEPQHWPTALGSAHTRRIRSRFSPATPINPAFPILYLAEDHQVALYEVGALLGSPHTGGISLANPHQAWVLLNVRVILQSVADLTDPAEQQRLQTSAQELTGDWRGYQSRNPMTPVRQPTGLAPTQELGQALHGVPGLEGFRTVSARVPTHRGLAIFPDKLEPGSSVVFSNPATGADLRIP